MDRQYEVSLEARLIRALYRFFLLREPDPLGSATLSAALRDGQAIEDAMRNFIRSPEFARIHGQFMWEWGIRDFDEYESPLAPLGRTENLLTAPAGSSSAMREESSWDARRADRVFFEAGAGRKAIATVLKSYVGGVGATDHSIRQRARDTIERRLREPGNLGAGSEVFRDRFHLRREVIERYCPEYLKHVFVDADIRKLDTKEILPASKNSLYDPAWPYPFKGAFEYKDRPALNLYFTDEADVYVHPSYYVIYRRGGEESWTSGNLVGLGRFVLRAPFFNVAGSVVVVRDFFTGSNFAHFLSDAMTRLGHFCRFAGSQARDSMFVFGGLPSEFHKTVISAAERSFGISEEQCFFPRRGINIRANGNVYWFSDQQTTIRPAQLCHPQSVEILRGLGRNIGVPSLRQPFVYVSRSDSPQRFLQNESELTPHLVKMGFQVVRLAEMPMRDQIALMTGAECVVGPHGMGLLHLALHQGTPGLVELFHPVFGTLEYATLARAFGFPYRAIVGKEVDARTRSFSVDVDQVLEALRDLGVR